MSDAAHATRERQGPARPAWLSFFVLIGACAAPTTDRWRPAAPAPVARLESASAVLDGRIWTLGGITGIDGDMLSAQPSSRVDIYDPATDQWSRGPDLPADAPKHHLALAVIGSRLFVLAGFDGIIGRGVPTDAFRPIERCFVLENGMWRRIADAPIARGGATAQVIGGRIYVVGGTQNEGVDPYADTFEYDPTTDRWRARARMPTAREHVASCAVDGRMIVVGGWIGAPRTAQVAAESYNPENDQWAPLPPLGVARGGLGAAAIGSRCYVVGGEDWALPPPGTHPTLEVLDPGGSAWRRLAPMPTARHGAGVTSFGDRLYVITGGPSLGNSYSAVVEVYTP